MRYVIICFVYTLVTLVTLFCAQGVLSAQSLLSGYFKDSKDVGIPGVYVQLLSAKKHAVTDAKGFFSMPVVYPLRDTLVAQHITYVFFKKGLYLETQSKQALVWRLADKALHINTRYTNIFAVLKITR